MFTCAAPCEREHDCASSYAMDEQIWSLESVSRAFLMALKYPERQNLFFFFVFSEAKIVICLYFKIEKA
jgi:hypothetical protein